MSCSAFIKHQGCKKFKEQCEIITKPIFFFEKKCTLDTDTMCVIQTDVFTMKHKFSKTSDINPQIVFSAKALTLNESRLTVSSWTRPSVSYLVSIWSRLSSNRPDRSAIESVRLNLPLDASLILALIFACAIAAASRVNEWFDRCSDLYRIRPVPTRAI